ncbi:MAG TPA: SDR family oxidoreductase [Candidatus Megaira endosymbiont of Stentor roeselii]|nr:SDR family oxidoreductase [Candidatus Megaera endosymbiont of Stentor roeselii]
MQTNVMGIWYVTQFMAMHMKDNSIKGSIINIASINGTTKLGKNITGYCVSKAAVIQLTKALVGELSEAKIRINCIVPGLFPTPLTDSYLSILENRQVITNVIPLNFVATLSDLDGIILYLSSNKASRYVTGSSITVDGGMSWGG